MKAPTTFYVFDATKLDYIICPNAKPVHFNGIEGLSFFLHRPYVGDGKFAAKKWSISHMLTGRSIIAFRETQKEAYSLAFEKLQKEGESRLKRIIEAHIKAYGLAPQEGVVHGTSKS